MSLKIQTVVSTDTNPRVRVSLSGTKQDGTKKPAYVSFKFVEYSEYIDKNGDIQDQEKIYTINVTASTDEEARELSKVVKSSDLKKYPLQIVCEPLTYDVVWKDGKIVGEYRDKLSANAVSTASELLQKLKK